MTDVMRVGVMGLSHDHVWSNLETLVARDDVELVGAADENYDLITRFNERFGRPFMSGIDNLLEFAPDAVYVFSSNAEGAEMAIKAAEAGCHVLVEKPMAATLEQADRMLAAARRNNVRLMVNWPFSWWPQLQHAVRMAQDGVIGRVWQVKYRAAHAGPAELGCSEEFCDWLFDPARNGGGGALMDYCCYGACLSRVLLGMPSRVTGLMGRFVKENITVEDNALIAMTWPNAMATAEASWTQVGKLTSYGTTIYGTEGTLQVEPRDGGRLLLATHADPEGSVVDVPEPVAHLKNSAAHFLHGVRTGEEFWPLCQDRVCRDTQEILEAGLRAARSGAEVSLPLRP
jgi:predicted dehydrogenase